MSLIKRDIIFPISGPSLHDVIVQYTIQVKSNSSSFCLLLSCRSYKYLESAPQLTLQLRSMGFRERYWILPFYPIIASSIEECWLDLTQAGVCGDDKICILRIAGKHTTKLPKWPSMKLRAFWYTPIIGEGTPHQFYRPRKELRISDIHFSPSQVVGFVQHRGWFWSQCYLDWKQVQKWDNSGHTFRSTKRFPQYHTNSF